METSDEHPKGGILGILDAAFSPVVGRSIFFEPPAPAPVQQVDPEPVSEPQAPKAAPKSAKKAAAAPAAKPAKKSKEPEPQPEPEPAPPPPPPPDQYELRIQAIKQACDAEVSQQRELGRYLVEQQEGAAASFARELAAKDAAYTRFWQYAGLPMKPSHLRLADSALASTPLLNPQTIVRAMQSEQAKEVLRPPAVTEYSDTTAAPHHLVGTQANANRARMRQDLLDRSRQMSQDSKFLKWNRLPEAEVKQLIKASKHRRHLNGLRMGGDQWDLESKIIASMQHKLAFKRNPRYDYMAPKPKKVIVLDANLTRPKFGTGQLASGSPKSKSYSTAKPGICFVCEPEEVVISRYEGGYVYEMSVQVRNVSNTMRRVRIVPPQSQYFFVSQLSYPGNEGIVAPGMAVDITLRFAPDSLADYEDAITVDTELSRMTVPLRAALQVPVLSLQQDTPLGAVHVGNTLKYTLPVLALSGAGTFRIVSTDEWAAELLEAPGVAVQIGPEFTVLPPLFSCGPGLPATLEIMFTPSAAGGVTRAFELVCDNCHVQHLTLSGEGVVPAIALTHINAAPLQPGQQDAPVALSDVVPGSTHARTVGLTNSGALELPFCWLQRVRSHATSNTSSSDAAASAETSTAESSAATIAATPMDDNHSRGAVFAICPAAGVLMPGETLECTLSFAPDALGRFACDFSVCMNPTWPPGSGEADVVALEFSGEGRGAPHPACVTPSRLCVPGTLCLGDTAVQHALITNPSDAPAHFCVTGGTEAVWAEPSTGTVAPGTSARIALHAHALTAAPFAATLLCSIDHGSTVPLYVSAPRVTLPRLTVDAASLQMGLLQLHQRAIRALVLHNPSAHTSALWQLHEDASAVHTRLANATPAGAAAPCARAVFMRSRGVLGPGESVAVEVHCVGEGEGSYRSTVCITCGTQVIRLPVLAEVVEPCVVVTGGTQRADLGVAYVGVPVQRTVTLQNATQLCTRWEWPGALLGEAAANAQVSITPRAGLLAGGASVTLALDIRPLIPGLFACLTALRVAGQAAPVQLQVLADVRPLSVSYTILDPLRQANTATAQLAGTASNEATEHGDSDAQAPADPVAGPQFVCFGREIPLGAVRTRVLCIQNLTGIETDIRLWVDHFVAGSSGALTEGVQSIRRMSNNAARTGRGVSLTSAHERTHPFTAAAGNDMIAMRSVQDTAKRLLGDKGLALSLTPVSARLPPFEELRCEVQCVNNMVGEYLDTLHLAVGDLPVRDIVVRAGVAGTPVHVQQAANLIPGLQKELSRSMRLAFGAAPCGVRVTKQFHVFNTACFDMEIDLRVVTYETRADQRQVETALEVDGSGALRLACRPVTSDAPACYQVEPTHLRLGKGRSGRVRVTFLADAPGAHEAYVEGTQRLISPAAGVQLKLYPHDAAERSAGLPELCVFLQGSFHPHAAPPTLPVLPLTVQLSAECAAAHLEPDQMSELAWCVHSIHAPRSHASFVHIITLSNLQRTPLALTVGAEGPFVVLAADASLPQEAKRFAGATFFDAAAFASHSTDPSRASASAPLFLPPRESVDVTVKLTPPPRQDLADYQLQGDLVVHYLNGEEQRLPLRADVLHPHLSCRLTTGADAHVIDFGAVHPRAPKWIDVVLTNSANVDAVWQVHAGTDASPTISLAAERDPAAATLAAFQVSPGQGLLRRQGLTAAQTKRVRLTFSPPDNRPHEVVATFTVLGGVPCSIVLRGQGTFDETSEFLAELQGL